MTPNRTESPRFPYRSGPLQSAVEFFQIAADAVFCLSRLMESEIHEGFDPGLRCRSANRGNAGILAGRHFDVSRQARRIYQVQSSNSGSCALIGNRKPHREIDMTRPLLSLDLADARRIIAAGERKAIEMGIPYNGCRCRRRPGGACAYGRCVARQRGYRDQQGLDRQRQPGRRGGAGSGRGLTKSLLRRVRGGARGPSAERRSGAAGVARRESRE
jgi:hypothetical protein